MKFSLTSISRGRIFKFLPPGITVGRNFALEEGHHEFFQISGNSITAAGNVLLSINEKPRNHATLTVGNVLRVVCGDSSISLEVLELSPEDKKPNQPSTATTIKAK